PTPTSATFTYTVHLAADDATVAVQHSPDLQSWSTITGPIISQQLNLDDNTRSITVEIPGGESSYARVQVSAQVE
ncbi:MAG: hypothetical protein ACR2RV_20595, partial [Verrucomicrobiales bacterium]